ncbi:helix-turn-helix transcriptional regulator [Kineosporia babensis]|uniref:Helix-turn-helix transcriptional regulator n=1 Tax=Kineosporia babensis TaxID=499548 RepID=A0A9X1NKR7_9ACTN|nr:helix-turn-helix transcriptional regulator [Kineosporia babensis]MCD5314976.1 helix-turn-helix transcriptional regulator [Kineosporia babensis]
MKLSRSQQSAVHDIETICASETDSRTLRRRVAARLSREMHWDAACFATIDPWTMLITDEISEGVPDDSFALVAHNEYLVDDVNKLVTLARSSSRVGILSQALEQSQHTSPRLETVLAAFDVRHELRAAFVADGQCWGALALFRNGGRTDFGDEDAALVQTVTFAMAVGLRRTATQVDATVELTDATDGPGVLVLNQNTEVLMANQAASAWLQEFPPHTIKGNGGLPLAVHQVVARVRMGSGASQLGAYARIRTRAGHWLMVQGSLIGTPEQPDQGVSVVISKAPSSDIAELLMLAYGLTLRERQVLQRVIAGLSSAGIAAQMHISVNTVQDHLKAVFAKVGVRSRGELVAQLLGRHYLPAVDSP